MPLSPYDPIKQSQDERNSIRNYIDQGLLHFESKQSRLVWEMQRVRARNNWLTGAVLLLFLGLGGLSTWLVLDTRLSQQTNKPEFLSQVDAAATKIQQLEQQLEDLQQQIPPDLTAALRSNQGAVQQLESQVKQLVNQLNTLQSKLPDINIFESSSDPQAMSEDDATSETNAERER